MGGLSVVLVHFRRRLIGFNDRRGGVTRIGRLSTTTTKASVATALFIGTVLATPSFGSPPPSIVPAPSSSGATKPIDAAAVQPPIRTSRNSGYEIRGRVVLASDDSAAIGATVYLSKGVVIVPKRARLAKTDSTGSFRFENVSGGNYRLYAESGNRISHRKKFEGEQVTVSDEHALPPITLQLADGCRFRVNVKTAVDNRPIVKASVGFRWADIERRYETDAKGSVLIEGVRPESQVFEVRAPDYAVESKTVAPPQPGTTTELTFSLSPGGQIRGKVRDAEGRVLRNVGISARAKSKPSDQLAYQKSDQKGEFFFDNMPLDEAIDLSVSHQNRWKTQTVLLTGEQHRATADIVFERRVNGGSILVTVTGPDQKPIAGARLSNPGSSTQYNRLGLTSESGQCRLDDVYDMSGRHRLFIRAKGFAPREISFKPGTTEKPAPVDVQLEQGHRIHARVMLTNGQPAANVRVFYAGGEHPWTVGGSVSTDTQGRFAIDSLPQDCTFTIYSPKGSAPFTDQRLNLDRDVETIVTLDAASLVVGRVVDAVSGKATVPYRIRIMSSSTRRTGEPWALLDSRLNDPGQIITRVDGEFKFGDLPFKAPMRLMISADGYVDQALDRVIARPEGEFKPLEIRLVKTNPQSLRTISGRLLSFEGKPVAGAQLRFWSAPSRPAEPDRYPFNWTMITIGQLEQSAQCLQYLAAVTNSDGKFEFRNVRDAAYVEVAYWGDSIAPGRQAFAMSENAERKIKFELRAKPEARLIIEVDRAAWPNAKRLSIFAGQNGLFDYRDVSISAGRQPIVFGGLPAGEFSVNLTDAGHDNGDNSIRMETLAHKSITLKPGETATIQFNKP